MELAADDGRAEHRRHASRALPAGPGSAAGPGGVAGPGDAAGLGGTAGPGGVAGPGDAAVPGRPRLALIDGYSLFHRAFFALPPLTSPAGQPTGALYGFLAMLLRLLQEHAPTHLAVALDMAGPTFRHEAFAAYKGQRPEAPDELRSQFPLLREALDTLHVATVEHPGVEADDILGTLSFQAAAAGFDVLVVTGDRDALQLADDSVRILLTRRGITDTEVVDRAAVRARYDLEPSQLVDVKALCGDTSDNIPGVPTIGEKTAVKLVRQFGSLDRLLAALDEVGPPRVAKALAEHREMLPRNRRLAAIVRDVPIAVDLDALARREPDPDGLRALLENWGFHSLLRRFALAATDGAGAGAPDPPAPSHVRRSAPAVPSAVGPDTEGAASDAEPSGPAAGGDRSAELRPWPGTEALRAAAGPLAAHCVEADVPLVVTADAVFRAPDADCLAPLDVGPPKLGYDLKPWVRALLRAGRHWRPVGGDALVAAYLLDAGRSGYPLEDLAQQYLGYRPREAASAARAAYDLCPALEAELEARGLGDLYREVELPLIEVLASMERHGILVDRHALEELRTEFASRLRSAEAAVHEAAGEAFNINSTQQLAGILFGPDRLGLRPPKKTKTGYSTDAEVLEQLALEHPLPERVLEYRTLQKLQSTYVEALGGLIDPEDGRVHTTFGQTVAATGRLSSSNPNLQNIPVREEVGRRIRRVFVAPPGSVLLAADYSQIELRLLAHLSGDADLQAAFRRGVDFHRETAAQVFGVPESEVTPEQRGAAKATSFGIVYGISDFGLARQLRTGQPEAHAVIERYFARFPGVKTYLDGSVAEARRTGCTRTLFGRIRHLPDITGRNWARRSFAERMAMNSPLQGTAADLIKRAMVDVHRELEGRGLAARLLLQVHDELIFECPEAERDTVAGLARACMEGVGRDLAVPLLVEVKSGANWCDMAPLPA